MRPRIYGEEVSRQREEAVLSLEAEAVLPGGQCAGSPVRERRSERSRGTRGRQTFQMRSSKSNALDKGSPMK